MERGMGLVVALGLMAVCLPAYAAEDWMATCKSISGIAEVIMKGRQAGGSMADMMTVDTGNETVTKMGRILVIQAFEQPRFETEEFQNRSVVDFSNKAYRMCANALSK